MMHNSVLFVFPYVTKITTISIVTKSFIGDNEIETTFALF